LIGDDLIRRGHSLARVEKILGGNFARLYSEAWG
jgi:microsomal dipeptidase-like Zn-dependent dipeptidase